MKDVPELTAVVLQLGLVTFSIIYPVCLYMTICCIILGYNFTSGSTLPLEFVGRGILNCGHWECTFIVDFGRKYQILSFLSALAWLYISDVVHFSDQYLWSIAAGSTSAVHGCELRAGEIIGQRKSQHPEAPAAPAKEQVARQRFYCTSNQLRGKR